MSWSIFCRPAARLSLTALGVITVLSCAESSTDPGATDAAGVLAASHWSRNRLARIVVTPATDTLNVGGTQAFTAAGKDRYGNAVQITPTWSVVAGGGTITAAGVFTAGTSAGSYAHTVQATSGSVSGTATVVVTAPSQPPPPPPPAPETLTVSPGSVSFAWQVGAANPAAQTLSIGSVSGHALAWTARTTLGSAWLSLASASGTTPSSVQMSVVTAGLALGSYSDTIQVVSTGAANSPRKVPVVLVVTAASGYATPDIINNASFEATDGDGSLSTTGQWDGFTNYNLNGSPVGDDNSAYATLTLDTSQHYSGSQSVKYTWWAQPVVGDHGAQMERDFTGQDRVWIRFYFRLQSGWSLGIQKIITGKGTDDATILMDLDLSSQGDGLKFYFVSEAGAGGTTIIPTASITPDTWHSFEIDLWRNGDTGYQGVNLPSAAFWYDGKQIINPRNGGGNGPDPAYDGTYFYWYNGRLYPGYPKYGRGSSLQFAQTRWVTTHNSPNNDSGTLWLDRIAISSLGRIGP
jgi:hypothetical protein